ncbi:MAG: SIS domain-containing protein [Armatimonadota bacterium]|nr:SIS domain-containing protein [Armatimonadota bacterium]
MSAEAYFQEAEAGLGRLQETQLTAIEEAAELLTEAVVEDRKIFSFGTSHSFMLTEEAVYRTGTLMLVNPIYPHGMNLSVRPMTLTSQIERVEGLGATLLEGSPASEGDVLIIASTSGRNPVPVDMALAARESGISTIAITSLEYSRQVDSRHPSGQKLYELCDVVIDNCAPLGDSAVEVPGFQQAVGPLSTVLGCAVVNAVVAQVVANLVERGVDPPVFVSANMPGGDEHNQRLLAENADRIFYMD